MNKGIKFNRLSNAIKENTSYVLSQQGVQLVQTYHNLIKELEKNITPVLENITTNPVGVAKQAAVQIVSSINSNKQGNEQFVLMSRLDTLTNGGKTPIQGSSFTFNNNDKILQYLEKMQ